MSAVPAFFEHIAIAVRAEDLAAWVRVLRADLGGDALTGGTVEKIGFQGGQVVYPDAGMLELVTWTEAAASQSAMKRYVDRHGGDAALHHLTFLVDDFDAAVERSRALGHEPMLGRNTRRWKEFYVRAPGLRPEGFLIQVLQADKESLLSQPGWGEDWAPFHVEPGDVHPPVRIAGARLASADLDASERLFVDLLGARAQIEGAGRVLSWPASSMRLWLAPEGEGRVRVRPSPDDPTPLAERLAAEGRPEAAARLIA